ncbi:MAG: hypothetical protein XD43_0920 [Thermococcales archaeon 44_46]|nr:MAG: hypothetical protein XD43_0920 [Thermococcales archaeon 44_46]HIH73263.1 hypothetical protein [Thermococcaceae archaeon]
MYYFPSGRTVEIEREFGTIFKKRIKKNVPVVHDSKKRIRDWHNRQALIERLEQISERVPKKHIEEGITHTFPPPRYEGESKYILVISPTEYDYTATHNFFSLLGAVIGSKTRDSPRTLAGKLMAALEKTWNILRDMGYVTEFDEIVPYHELKNKSTYPAVIHPPWDQLKKDRKFLDVVLDTYSKYTGIPREKIEQHIDDIINAVDAVTEASMKQEDISELIRNGKIPELEKVLYIMAGKKPGEVQPAKFREVQKQVEQELKEKGEVKVIAPRLATAIWLENQIRALKESSFAKMAGGVPASELRALKEKILAKKHVAEKASELVEKEWMRGNIVSVKEEHLDKKLLPLVKEHAAEMLEDIKALAERVKKGELDAQDVRTILAVERDLLDRTHEAVERTLGNPEHLMENRRVWGVEDKFLVKKEAIEKMHEELKPHFETARVKILKK